MMFYSRTSIPIIFRNFILAGLMSAEFVTAPDPTDVLSEERAALHNGGLTWSWDLNTSTYVHPSHITKNPPGHEDAVRNSYTDLHLAAYGGKKEVIEGLIKPGTGVGDETKGHVKPGADLGTEIKDHVKAGTDLGTETKDHVKPGADINAKTKDGKTALSLAVVYGHDEIVKLLLENGASTWMPENFSLLDVAVISGNTRTVKHLIDTGKFVLNERLKYAHYITVLHRAVLCQNLEMVELLVSQGSSVNYQDTNDNTGLAAPIIAPAAYMYNRTKDNKVRSSLTQKCNLIPAGTHAASPNKAIKGA
ncbi:serine/threonine-protein phosphatase 6 regulatory ankyrin repeat subunit B [Ditylenchus destructor]|uniref:Serine/threonine-protein phosphatase 6 regulatory ankyrin repeat subunit B n=1 Tax=Ditylenchus destructor TaxID=166010 RepID=A0AAD4N1E3_9BILA|nr:serine/threonine-protein phosphatase 6 regulatory ankyrin repeat subunit B [Ditylenchus destructor]